MQFVEREHPFRIRPMFIIDCLVGLAVFVAPVFVVRSFWLERTVLVLAALSIVAGWVFLLKESARITRKDIPALIAAVYLFISLPVFLFETSQWRWLVLHPRHHWFSMYVRPWVHWGDLMIFLSVIFSFFGRGRARIAFVTGSLLLLVLRSATGIWVQ
jgi:hypothetical protein